jgi:hypothetical protein
MQTLKVNPKKTLADYGYTTTQPIPQPPKITGPKKLTIRTWWRGLEQFDDINYGLHYSGAQLIELHATITAETPKAYLLTVPRQNNQTAEAWIPKSCVHTITEA